MKDKDKAKEQLITELGGMRKRISKLRAMETEQKQAEEALRKSEHYLRKAQQIAHGS